MSAPAARLTDMHTCPMVTGLVPHVGGPISAPGSRNVFIEGLLAARVTDQCVCVGPPDAIVKGSLGVFINGLAAARIGDPTSHGGVITLGAFKVFIGDAGLSGASGAGAAAPGAASSKAAGAAKILTQTAATLQQAHVASKPFCEICK